MSRSNPDAAGYFLYHSIGLYPGKEADLAAAMAEFARVWAAPDDQQWPFVLGKRQDFIDHWRAILNAPEGSATTCESVTDGLHKVMRALPDGQLRGKRVLVAADCFPSLHFLLQGLAPRIGFTLDTVPLSPGKPWVETDDFLARWGRDVGLALITWVTSTASARVDLAPLVAHGRDMNSLIGVDITQAAGLLPFDVQNPKVDFAISTSLKWMCGTPGAGILHIDTGLAQILDPDNRGWFSQDNPFSWDLDSFAYAPDMRSFDGGTPGAMPAIASLPALRWHAAQDHAAIAARNRKLTGRIIACADALGLPLNSPRDPDRRGGSVMLRLADIAQAKALTETLAGHGYAVDFRGPILRLSPGVVTGEEAIDTLFDVIETTLSR
ncbi:aminotransferase class V-fold PLP-dependent enzyme [Marimonas lutisalis]|uniref:aminotransferase class V-fold PLP-dependent enzyme n=1 Tax=Marimonas lutisalis TaxID=2545756 RepID=UPI0010F61072|nr:aminotransferase class V-fold PLP-dependent enzyme [Marimonas lutisalis]